MTPDEVVSALRRIYVDESRPWDENYDAYLAALESRIGCFSTRLAGVSGRAVRLSAPTGDVHYFSLEAALSGPADHSLISPEAVTGEGGELIYLAAYCSTILPLVEVRWHIHTLDPSGKRLHKNYDLFGEEWLGKHAEEAELALKVAEAAEHCGWQLIGPEITEQQAPKDWPWPLPSYDYQDGEYLVRDYILKGMRDY